ncbi:MAG: AAA family ATPase [Defluviitaleaceae bacterium]|nr:AAA family ATPase [Defluviitaleaceae bacterium]
MYLKRIEILGFKSFKEKTKLTLSNGITAIVGPNGSGKSNIVDSIRWVLGEQNAKNLRGTKMEDIIFSGGKNTKPLGLASVSLVLDNENSKFKIPFNEIIITRKVYRSGESEYQINGSTCRLKDITELFMDTGIGKDGYSIIGQGDVEQLLQNNQRKYIFEEATGINKHKARKDLTISKIEKEEENLQRLKDIIFEVESNLPKLEISSKKAKEFLKLNEQLKILKVNLFLNENEKITKDLDKLHESLNIINSQIKEEEEETNKNDLIIETLKSKILEIFKKSEDIGKNILNNKLSLSEKEAKIPLYKEQIKNQLETIENFENEIKHIKKKQTDSSKEIEKYTLTDYSLNKDLTNKKKIKDDLEKKLQNNLENIKTIEFLENEYTKEEYRLNFLQNNYTKAVHSILNAKKTGEIKGIIDTIGNLINVTEHLKIAIDISLGGAVNYIVTYSQEDAKKAIEYLKKTKSGRATFLPVSNIKYRENKNPIPKSTHVLGKASELITYDKSFFDIINVLIGDVIITDNLDNSIEIKTNYKIITLEGDIISKTGAMTGGIVSSSKSKEISEIKTKINSIFQKTKKISKENESIKETLERLKIERDIFINNITNIKIELNSIYQHLDFNKKLLENSMKNSEENKDKEIIEKINTLKEKNAKKEIEIDEIDFQIKEIIKQNKILEENLKKLEIDKKEFQDSLLSIEKERKDNNQIFYDIQSEQQRLTYKIETLQEKRILLYNNIWDEYEITYNTAQNYEKLNLSTENLKNKESDIKNKIKELGPISLESIEEYSKVKERWEFLETQKNDIEETIDKLKKIIEDLTKEMEISFHVGIENISKDFDTIFKEMFEGGEACLKLSNKDDILNSSIEIVARPPGKKIININLMSLGEKTLTSISLLFSILKTRPSPFILLDEIEAPLDYANNLKFANYIKKIHGSIQFIIITHKRLTMEVANEIYGVTMDEGISKLISTKI